MTPDEFSSLALGLAPTVIARPILDAVQFRIGAKAFATLGWPDARWAVVKLDPRRQAWALSLSPALCPEPGRRRRAGIVLARLSALEVDIAAQLLSAAWSDGQRSKRAAPRALDDVAPRVAA
jgi:hypothetical protein